MILSTIIASVYLSTIQTARMDASTGAWTILSLYLINNYRYE